MCRNCWEISKINLAQHAGQYWYKPILSEWESKITILIQNLPFLWTFRKISRNFMLQLSLNFAYSLSVIKCFVTKKWDYRNICILVWTDIKWFRFISYQWLEYRMFFGFFSQQHVIFLSIHCVITGLSL